MIIKTLFARLNTNMDKKVVGKFYNAWFWFWRLIEGVVKVLQHLHFKLWMLTIVIQETNVGSALHNVFRIQYTTVVIHFHKTLHPLLTPQVIYSCTCVLLHLFSYHILFSFAAEGNCVCSHYGRQVAVIRHRCHTEMLPVSGVTSVHRFWVL